MFEDNADLINGPGAETGTSKPKRKAKAKRSKPNTARKAKATGKPKSVRKARAKKDTGYGPRQSTDMRVYHANPKPSMAAMEHTTAEVIQKAFGKGKTVGDVIANLSKNWEPPRAARYNANPRAFLLGCISKAVVEGLILFGKAG